jgi:8-oxo-dGTP diphosphatase
MPSQDCVECVEMESDSMNGRPEGLKSTRPAKTTAGAAGRDANFAPPFVTVDVVILALRHDRLQVLLVKRGAEPFRGAWALPGGYIHPDEDADLEAAARRILREKTGIETPYVEQLQSFGDARRDPRGWSATFAYFALIAADGLVLKRGGNAEDVAWSEVDGRRVRTALAFDHADILASAVTRLRNKVEYTSLPVHLLPAKFTLPDLQHVYEQILDRRIDKSAFRKRIAEANFLEPIPGEKRPASNRPAQIYRIKRGLATIFFDRTI